MLLLFAAALLLSEVVSQSINFFDRGSGVYRFGAQQMAIRIAQTARVLNRLSAMEHHAVAGELNDPTFNIGLSRRPVALADRFAEYDRYEKALTPLIKY